MIRFKPLVVLAVTTFSLSCDAALTDSTSSPEFAETWDPLVYQVTGGGTVESAFGLGAYAFQGSVSALGLVNGQVEIHFSSNPIEVHGAVTCVDVVGGDAWLGAVITRSNATGPGLAVGRELVWRVRDAGEGASAAPDGFRGFARRSAETCVNRPAFPLVEWTNGNVQVMAMPSVGKGRVKLCSARSSDGIATFADPNLDAAVRSDLGISSADDLTCGLVAALEHLHAGDQGILNLTGMENITGLLSADLGGNRIADISPLSELTSLETLGLFGNAITDISPVAGLTNLWLLEASNNGISDLSPLSGLTNLGHLGVAANRVTDVSPLAGLVGLETLGLGNNFLLSDIGALVWLTSLREVFLVNNGSLSDISALLNNAGIGAGDVVELWGTSVSCTDVATLQSKGASVASDC
jgi:hypothetical protein